MLSIKKEDEEEEFSINVKAEPIDNVYETERPAAANEEPIDDFPEYTNGDLSPEYMPLYIKQEEPLEIIDEQQMNICNYDEIIDSEVNNDNSIKKENIPKRKSQRTNNVNKEKNTIMNVDGSYRYPCNYCDKSYKNKIHATRHMRYQCKENRLKHKPVAKHFKCKLCFMEFTTKFSLKRHDLYIHNPSSSYTYSCDSCNKIFRDESSLKKHLKFAVCHTSRENSTYICKKCKMEFDNRLSLRQHRLQQCASSTTLYNCAHCDFLTVHKGDLPRHLERKHGEREDLTCPNCDKTYKGDFNLQQHLRRDCNVTVDKRFACDYCNYKAKRKYSVADHIRHKHKWVSA